MPRTKILYLLTKGNWGGAQRYVYDLATNLPGEQFSPVVICGQGRILPPKLAAAGCRVLTLPTLDRELDWREDAKIFFALFKIFRAEKPAIVHLNSSKVGGLGALAARLARVPRVIFTAHGWAFNEPRPRLVRAVIWLASWLTVILCHRVIVLSPLEQNQAKNFFGARRKIHLIPNGITIPAYLSRYDARAALGRRAAALLSEPTDWWLGNIGELHPNKGQEVLIEALARLPAKNWRAVIIGEGEERSKLERLIRQHHLDDRVFLLGFINEAANYLPAFDLFVFPSRKEGLPYAPLEAGFAGLPVIASRVGGLPEIIADGHTGRLVPPGDAAALALALTDLLTHHDQRRRLGDNLKREVNKFTLEAMLQKTISLYRETR